MICPQRSSVRVTYAGAIRNPITSAAAGTAPPEGRGRKRNLRLVRAVEDVPLVPLAREDVGQRGGVSERIDVVGDGRLHAETVPEVAPPVEELAPPGLLSRQVAVGLDVLTAGDVPLSALDQLACAREQLRVDPLDPLVDPCFPARVDELGVLVAAVGGGAECGQGLVRPGLPGPHPDRVDMGGADHVDDHGATSGCEARRPRTAARRAFDRSAVSSTRSAPSAGSSSRLTRSTAFTGSAKRSVTGPRAPFGS